MKLARILLPVHEQTDIKPMAETAFTLATRFGCSVEGIYPSIRPVDQFTIQDEAGAPLQYQKLLDDAKRQLKASQKVAGEVFQHYADRHPDIPTNFLGCVGNIAGIMGQRGRMSDMTVIGTAVEKDPIAPFWSDIRDGAIFRSGRPVVVASRDKISKKLGDTLVIAWKDGVEAARAVAAARPLLAAAKAIHIVSVGPDKAARQSLKQLESYLSLYNTDIDVCIIGKNKRNVAELLGAEAAKHDDALLVMGAYSQWRWKEWAFGGVTEYMLHKAPVPVLMAH